MIVFCWFYNDFVKITLLNKYNEQIRNKSLKITKNVCLRFADDEKHLLAPLSVHSWAGFFFMLGGFERPRAAQERPRAAQERPKSGQERVKSGSRATEERLKSGQEHLRAA